MNDQTRHTPIPDSEKLEPLVPLPNMPAGSETAAPSTTGCCSSLTTSWLVDGNPESVREALADMMMSVESCGTRDDLIHIAEMVLAEVLNNVVEHAYAGRTDGWIKIEIACTSADLRVRVSDRGISMPGLELPAGEEQDLDVPIDALPEGGFGWFMIRTLTADLAYSRVDDRNVITFRILSDMVNAL